MMIASHSRTRRGAITMAWLVFYSIVMIAMLWAAQQLSFRIHAREELHNANDAAAHAAARTLVTESFLANEYLENTSSAVYFDRTALINKARANGLRLASLNRVMSKPLFLTDNPDNDTDAELYVGTLDHPPSAIDQSSRTFIGLANTNFDPYHPDLNAVRVKEKEARFRVKASATYYLDRDVVGFRLKQPRASSVPFPALPMVPIAILSDPVAPPNDANNNTDYNSPQYWQTRGPSTWEGAILGRPAGNDSWSIGPSGQPQNVGDNIKEIRVTLTEGGNNPADNGQLVYFDGTTPSFATLVAQVARGITYGDLPANDGQLAGQFLLNDGTQVLNQASAATRPLPPVSSELTSGGAVILRGSVQNQTGLWGILGQPRVWMLYSGLPSQGNNPTVNVVGFVVARVMAVEVAGNAVTITLQPSVLVTDDRAVTAWKLRNNGPRSLYNPYIARLRFVE